MAHLGPDCPDGPGKIVQSWNARELYERPSTGFIGGFLGSINFLKARVVEPKGEAVPGLVTLWSETFGAGKRVFRKTSKGG